MDVVDILYAKNKFGGSGGSNPNRVQVITGTMDDMPPAFVMWDDQNEFKNALLNGDAHAVITIDGTALGLPLITNNPVIYREDYDMLFTDIVVGIDSYFVMMWLVTKITGGTKPFQLIVMSDGVSIEVPTSEYANVFITLTIYWHPMPSNTVGQAKVGQAQV